MLFNLTSLSSEPMHSQISKQLLEKILTDDYYDGTELPTPRALASEQHVNVNSVDRAYMTLIDDGLIEIKNGGRYFVPLFSSEKKQELRFRLLTENSPLNAIETLSGQLISVFDIEKLKSILHSTVKQHLISKEVFFILQKEDMSGFNLLPSEEYKDSFFIDKNDVLFSRIKMIQKPSLLSEIISENKSSELIAEFTKRNVQVVFPFIQKKNFFYFSDWINRMIKFFGNVGLIKPIKW